MRHGNSGRNSIECGIIALNPPWRPRVKYPAIAAALIAASMSSAAHAEWRELATGSVGRILYDPASVRTQGRNTTLQYRIDYRELINDPVSKKTAGSTIVNVSIDCQAKTVTLVSTQTHAAREGKGEMVKREVIKAPTAEAVTEGSSNQVLWQTACAPAAAPGKDSAPKNAPPKSAPINK
jgi:hypothetical protein